MTQQRRPWTLKEHAYLKTHYPTSKPISDIARAIDRSVEQVSRRARKLGLVRPRHCTELAVRNFEERKGKPLEVVADDYRQRRLSRSDLAADIGIYYGTLKRLLSRELWQSWPRNTVGRQLAREQRRA